MSDNISDNHKGILLLNCTSIWLHFREANTILMCLASGYNVGTLLWQTVQSHFS